MGKDIYTHCKGRSILIALGLKTKVEFRAGDVTVSRSHSKGYGGAQVQGGLLIQC